MAAYVVGASIVHDLAGFGEYQQRAAAVLARYGGRVIAGGAVTAPEGAFQPHGAALMEFPNLEQAHAWYDSPDYQALKALRQRSAQSQVFFLDGLPTP